MKRIISIKAILVSISICLLLFAVQSCKKNTSDTAECKTCKAFGIDGLLKEKEVCSSEDETSFRNEYAGKEIICQ